MYKSNFQKGVTLIAILYIDDLLTEFESRDVKAFAFADDLAISYVGKNQYILHAWSCKNELSINTNKSALILCSKNKFKQNDNMKYILPEVKTYKYLGVVITNAAKLTKHYKPVEVKMLYQATRIAMVKTDAIPPNRLMTLFFVICKGSAGLRFTHAEEHFETTFCKVSE